ncbi:BA75_01906T0 [Komagataella pastoris]|uniref:BA75_01906T0 n=1 Tax=Komagataella pastoris TaxID=4922 RepID=A0A1B2JD41_PICPA|nr:BA75_01906T0 [Komagataella pastoris]
MGQFTSSSTSNHFPKHPSLMSLLAEKDFNSGTFITIIVLISVTIIVTLTVILLLVYRCTNRRRIRLSNENPGEFADEDILQEEDDRAFLLLPPNEQELYFQARDFLRLNPIDETELALSQLLNIQERGISAWEFKPNANSIQELDVAHKTELTFHPTSEVSIMSNLPIPKTSDVHYFEAKIYSLKDPITTLVSIGLATSPYPSFRLPGRHRYSLCYESDGTRRYNQPFPPNKENGLNHFPRIQEGDVIGVGYRVRSGTIFFTRNGKKLSESKIGGHIKNFKFSKLYPIIGATNVCSIHVNLGQYGFVYIEANVKKWGFAPLEGTGPPPPAYATFNKDILLERSDVDEEDLESRNADTEFPPNFWDVANFSSSDNENITLNTIDRDDPPLYSD